MRVSCAWSKCAISWACPTRRSPTASASRPAPWSATGKKRGRSSTARCGRLDDVGIGAPIPCSLTPRSAFPPTLMSIARADWPQLLTLVEQAMDVPAQARLAWLAGLDLPPSLGDALRGLLEDR